MSVKATEVITLVDVSDGAAGKSVTSLTLYFKTVNTGASAPTKPTSATPSGWSTTEPTYDGSKDLYATTKTTFSDSTFMYSDPQKYATYESAKEAYNKAVAALANSVHQGTSPPPDITMLWLDTNTGVNKIKKYLPDPSGGTYSWQVINDYDSFAGSWSTWMNNWNNERNQIISDAQDLPQAVVDTIVSQATSATMDQLSDQIIMTFVNKETIQEWANEKISIATQERSKYIRFNDEGIELGEESSPFILKIKNGDVTNNIPPSIEIIKDNILVSQWMERTFTAPEVHIKENGWNYKFAFVPHSNGSLGFRKVVD